MIEGLHEMHLSEDSRSFVIGYHTQSGSFHSKSIYIMLWWRITSISLLYKSRRACGFHIIP